MNILIALLLLQGYPEGTKNTEDPKNVPLPPAEALKRISLPDGFTATLFAAEPDVAQPIAIQFDDRGRLWVAECYSYESSGGPWNQPVRDRILIFEDKDGNGTFDTRKVFWDQARNLTGLALGFGGVWLCSTPNFLFLADRNGDDVPDGEPEVLLDGWNDGKIGHCVFNGLTWGPDGWLYGAQGIQGDSLVGKPGAAERVKFNGGIWRFHPTKRIFEVVCEGTTNPWGLDWDDRGQAFFTNCVIGHLWHVIPGAHYERMYGKDFTPNTYALIKSTSDHVHFAGKDWTKSRTGAEHDVLGGGHAHAGALVYLGDNWPASYRGALFTHNIHGRRVNSDLLERRGSGYVGKHGPDLLRSADPWYRGVAIKTGPDGAVYLGDWSDVGECHDTKSVHRTSGRIYRIAHGTPKPMTSDLSKMPDVELAALQLHPNDWWVRQSRRILQERGGSGAKAALTEILEKNPDETRKLRAMWALHAIGALDAPALFGHESEHVRSWAVRLAEPSDAALAAWKDMAAKDASPLVRLFLASTLQRVPVAKRGEILKGLLARAEDAEDPNLPFMIWYALEPVVAADPAGAPVFLKEAKIPFVRQSITRRMATRD
ncbi:MAG TPA: PVC-type heme-binding CxxCH protein [Planctomycetota bacterium]